VADDLIDRLLESEAVEAAANALAEGFDDIGGEPYIATHEARLGWARSMVEAAFRFLASSSEGRAFLLALALDCEAIRELIEAVPGGHKRNPDPYYCPTCEALASLSAALEVRGR
jgi:hypothetical protein